MVDRFLTFLPRQLDQIGDLVVGEVELPGQGALDVAALFGRKLVVGVGQFQEEGRGG